MLDYLELEQIIKSDDEPKFQDYYFKLGKHEHDSWREEFLISKFDYIITNCCVETSMFPQNIANYILERLWEGIVDTHSLISLMNKFYDKILQNLNYAAIPVIVGFCWRNNILLSSWKSNKLTKVVFWKDFSQQFDVIFPSSKTKQIAWRKIHRMLKMLAFCLKIQSCDTLIFHVDPLEYMKIYDKLLQSFQYGQISTNPIDVFKTFTFFFRHWINFESKDQDGNTPFLLFFKHYLFVDLTRWINFFRENKVNVFQHNKFGQTISFFITQYYAQDHVVLEKLKIDPEVKKDYANKNNYQEYFESVEYYTKIQIQIILFNVPTCILPIPWSAQRLLLISHLKQKNGVFRIIPYEIIVKIFEFSTERNNYYYQNVLEYYPDHWSIRGCRTCFTSQKQLFYCGDCLSVSYCSKTCQVKHWKFHKAHCLEFKKQREKQINCNKNNNMSPQFGVKKTIYFG